MRAGSQAHKPGEANTWHQGLSQGASGQVHHLGPTLMRYNCCRDEVAGKQPREVVRGWVGTAEDKGSGTVS